MFYTVNALALPRPTCNVLVMVINPHEDHFISSSNTLRLVSFIDVQLKKF